MKTKLNSSSGLHFVLIISLPSRQLNPRYVLLSITAPGYLTLDVI